MSNLLLAALPPQDRREIAVTCEVVRVEAGQSLLEPGEPIQFVYFPTGCLISLLSTTDRSSQLEVALIGAEGMVGTSSVLEVEKAPFRALVRGTGTAWRMPAGDFLRHLEQRPALARRLARYLYLQVLELAQLVTCTRFHSVEPRLARWLLVTRDRAHTSHFHLTHDAMAMMLGVRRAGITIAAGSLQARGLITYHRGWVSIRDTRGLKRASCSCYARSRATYARCLG